MADDADVGRQYVGEVDRLLLRRRAAALLNRCHAYISLLIKYPGGGQDEHDHSRKMLCSFQFSGKILERPPANPAHAPCQHQCKTSQSGRPARYYVGYALAVSSASRTCASRVVGVKGF